MRPRLAGEARRREGVIGRFSFGEDHTRGASVGDFILAVASGIVGVGVGPVARETPSTSLTTTIPAMSKNPLPTVAVR